MVNEDWNTRFVCYAASHGREPREQIEHDAGVWLGGKMAGYIIWIGERWREWKKETKFSSSFLLVSDHERFDAWLAKRFLKEKQ